ncbi:MAG: hypothetical protein MJ142_05920 [Clostridia bacterium]|nr:hypothetical protein [Clostridia bacterium]
MMNGRTRSSVMTVAALYMGYMAYSLFQGRNDPDTTMPPAVAVLFAVLFALAAIGLVVYSVRLWKARDDNKENEQQEESDQMK